MPKSIGFWRTTYVTWTQSFVSVYLAVSEKTGGQTDKQTNRKNDRQTNETTREPLSKGDSRTGLIVFHIQLPLPTLTNPFYTSYF